MGTKVIYQDSGTEVLLSVDGQIAVTSRELERRVIIPNHPTTSGFVNDSVILEPRKVLVEGTVSNVKDYFGEASSTADSYRLLYEGKFEDLLTAKELVVIEAYNRQYSNMRLESYSFTDNIDGFDFTLNFVEMNLPTSKKVKSTVVKKKPVASNNPKKQKLKPPPAKDNTNNNKGGASNNTDCGNGTKKPPPAPQPAVINKSWFKTVKDFFVR